jgi:D-glycero-alpha-D-manno-heptose-7-phosphate kinase
MEIKVTAPNRIDLAGGTTDLYPLYLLMDGGYTVNLAISLSSRVILRDRVGSGIRIISEDLEESVEAASPEGLPLDGPLGLIGRAVRALPPETGLEVVTRNHAPAGSGLGASSALLVALLKGLLELRSDNKDSRNIVDLAVNIETAAIGVPAGKQDHIAAVYGGVSLIDFTYRDFERHAVPEDRGAIERLEEMIVLSYTGEGRFSGMNNWEVTKGFIDNMGDVRENLLQIRDVARKLGRTLLFGEWENLGPLVAQEWQLRRMLAPGVSTPRIESIMAGASAAGALASKICGAGGGGCMLTVVEPPRRSSVENAIVDAGGEVIPFKIDREGLASSHAR